MSKKKRQPASVLPAPVRRHFPNVKYVEDAKEAIEISVCANDVKSAEPLNPSNCALARAAKREQGVDGAIIGISSSYIIRGDRAIRFDTPDSVRAEIVSFDRHSDFEPGDYYLRPKSPSSTLGNPGHQGSRASGPSGRAKNRVLKRVRVLTKNW